MNKTTTKKTEKIDVTAAVVFFNDTLKKMTKPQLKSMATAISVLKDRGIYRMIGLLLGE